MPDPPRGLLTASLMTLTYGAIGIGMGCATTPTPLALTLAGCATFATNLLATFTIDSLSRLRTTWRARPSLPASENHVILRNLRAAQLDALDDITTRYQESHRFDPDDGRRARAQAFAGQLRARIKAELTRAKTLSDADLADITDADASRLEQARQRRDAELRTATARRAAADLSAAFAARHGNGPALDAIRAAAETATLAEVAAADPEIPAGFLNTFLGGPDGLDGWFALFIRRAADRIRENPALRDTWQVEQQAAILHLLEQTGTDLAEQRAEIENLSRQTLDQFAEQGAFLAAIADTAAGTASLLQSLAARLDDTQGWLYQNTAFAPIGWLRFHALNRAIPFQGREPELAELDAFLADARQFAWWIVTGPGGAGKTRLALELCLRVHRQGWQAGFLRKPFRAPEPTWRPSRPTLIVADYVSEQPSAIAALARDLANLPDGLPVIRLLLLERTADEFFLSQFYRGATTTGKGVLEGTRHADTWLQLPGLTEDELWALVQKTPWRSSAPTPDIDRAKFFSNFRRIDKNGRALVAMLLADAIAEQPEAASFETADLPKVLRELLSNAREHHFPPELRTRNAAIGTALPADALIAAATLTGCLTGSYLENLEKALGQPVIGQQLIACAHAIGSEIHRDQRCLDGVQPDLIGEFFTLEALRGDPPDPSPLLFLPEMAWRTDEKAMAAFVVRALQNFPSHESIPLIATTFFGVTRSWWLEAMRVALATDDPLGPAGLQAVLEKLWPAAAGLSWSGSGWSFPSC